MAITWISCTASNGEPAIMPVGTADELAAIGIRSKDNPPNPDGNPADCKMCRHYFFDILPATGAEHMCINSHTSTDSALKINSDGRCKWFESETPQSANMKDETRSYAHRNDWLIGLSRNGK